MKISVVTKELDGRKEQRLKIIPDEKINKMIFIRLDENIRKYISDILCISISDIRRINTESIEVKLGITQHDMEDELSFIRDSYLQIIRFKDFIVLDLYSIIPNETSTSKINSIDSIILNDSDTYSILFDILRL